VFLGRYILGEPIGSGGRATVRLARRADGHPDEWPFAIKLMHPNLARDPEYAALFRDEARLAQRLNHPYVCRVFDSGESNEGVPYMVMEHLAGRPLSHVIPALRAAAAAGADSGAHAALAARLVAWLCEGLHALHELRGDDGEPLHVVHRDVSPQNVFVLPDGSIRLLDFGIAKGDLLHAQTGSLRGKAPYMAPEYLLSEGFDRRMDIWSLGVVLWELLALDTLFGGMPELQTLQCIVSTTPRTPSSVRGGLPAALDLIVARALLRDPALRFPTARDLGGALEQWLATLSQPVSAHEVAAVMSRLFPEVALTPAHTTEVPEPPTPSGPVSRRQRLAPRTSAATRTLTRPTHADWTASTARPAPHPSRQNELRVLPNSAHGSLPDEPAISIEELDAEALPPVSSTPAQPPADLGRTAAGAVEVLTLPFASNTTGAPGAWAAPALVATAASVAAPVAEQPRDRSRWVTAGLGALALGVLTGVGVAHTSGRSALLQADAAPTETTPSQRAYEVRVWPVPQSASAVREPPGTPRLTAADQHAEGTDLGNPAPEAEHCQHAACLKGPTAPGVGHEPAPLRHPARR
jgi:serine/threonine-protein kinase